MATRNTRVLKRIVKALGIKPQNQALARLEQHFANELLLVAGNTDEVAAHAEQLRFSITPAERLTVLDYLARRRLLQMNLDDVEAALNARFEDRFIEP